MNEPNYPAIIRRITDIMKANDEFDSCVSEYIFNNLPEEHIPSSYPACYVTIPREPELTRKSTGSAKKVGYRPYQEVITKFLIVLVGQVGTAEDAQKSIYNLKDHIINMHGRNTQLRDNNGLNPLCNTSELSVGKRFTKQCGESVDGLELVLKVYNQTKIDD